MQGQSSTHVLTCQMTHDGYKGRCGAMITSGAASEDFLLALLNTTPVVDGAPTDELAAPARGRSGLATQGADGSEAEWQQVRAAREALQAVVRGDRPAADLAPFLAGAVARPGLDGGPGRGAAQGA